MRNCPASPRILFLSLDSGHPQAPSLVSLCCHAFGPRCNAQALHCLQRALFPCLGKKQKQRVTFPISNAQEEPQVAGTETERTIRGTCRCGDISALNVRIATSPWTSPDL